MTNSNVAAPGDVSVVIPAYNSERYLGEAIDSCLQQSHPPNEVIVVDDGSTDGTREVALGFGSSVRYIFQENGGSARARNSGATAAGGEFLAFLDSDDLWLPDKLERQLACFETDPELDLVFGHARQFICPLVAGQPGIPSTVSDLPLPAQVPSAMLARRRAFDRVGLFAPELRIGDCLDWYARARDAGLKDLMLPAVLFHRRIHDRNLGRTQKDRRSDYVRALKANLDRRRRGKD